jgi:hypothetical protein
VPPLISRISFDPIDRAAWSGYGYKPASGTRLASLLTASGRSLTH